MAGTTGPSPAGRLAAYLDAASSEALHPAARTALLAAVDQGFADPLRLHGSGRGARMLLDNARQVVAECLAVRPDEVSFASSGTAAVHAGVLGLLEGRRRVSDRLVHSAVEHSSVIQAGRWHARRSAGTVASVPVDRLGRVDIERLGESLGSPTAVLAVQSANQEVGTTQPMPQVAEAAAAAGVPLFVDACASAGRVALPDGWSAAAASAHKWGGPAGVGVLLVRTGARWRAPFPTDDRADPRASGFENVPGVLAAAAALQAVVAERDSVNASQGDLIARIRARVAATVDDVEVLGHPDERLPHICAFSFLYVDGETLVRELDRLGFAVASGSACTSSTLSPSHVLEAMGVLTHGNVRLSLARDTTVELVDGFLEVLPGVVRQIRSSVGMR
jgi:cysteine desulfurase